MFIDPLFAARQVYESIYKMPASALDCLGVPFLSSKRTPQPKEKGQPTPSPVTKRLPTSAFYFHASQRFQCASVRSCIHSPWPYIEVFFKGLLSSPPFRYMPAMALMPPIAKPTRTSSDWNPPLNSQPMIEERPPVKVNLPSVVQDLSNPPVLRDL